MRLSIITPCLNSLPLLKETVYSILEQKALKESDLELEYIICDGGSADGSVEWIESLDNSCINLISGPDKGLYDALSKGFSIATGDIISYLNAGDYYSPMAFSIVKDVFSNSHIKWVTGYNTWYNQKGYLVKALLPFRYRRELIQKGIYGYWMPWLWIQQESTFWRRNLLSGIDSDKFARLKFSGDYYLWYEFSKITQLHIVKAYIGGFRRHAGQLSEEKKHYQKEMSEIFETTPSFCDIIKGGWDTVLWFMPDRIKYSINREIIIL